MLIAEQNDPQAEVPWANEPIRAEVLRQRGSAAACRKDGLRVSYQSGVDRVICKVFK